MNAYEMLTEVRENIGEDTAAHWGDLELLRKLSASQSRISMMLMLSSGDWLMSHESVTPVASVITLPSTCAKPVYLEETSSGRNVPIKGTVRERRMTRPDVSSSYVEEISAYPEGNTLVVNQSSYTTACTLWYQKRVLKLIAGTADTGSGASALVFATTAGPSYVDDYYNGATFEIVGGTLVGNTVTVSDYTGSTRTAVIVGTVGTTSVYGMVSVLPEECHDLLVLQATLQALAKPSSNLDPEVFKYWNELARIAKKDLTEWIASRESGSKHVRITEIE